MDEDLSVSRAWAVLFDWVREQNRLMASSRMSPEEAAEALAFWHQVDRVFGLGEKPDDEVPTEVLQIAQERLEAKRARDFGRADSLRKRLGDLGWAFTSRLLLGSLVVGILASSVVGLACWRWMRQREPHQR